jgi:hypothetical protein
VIILIAYAIQCAIQYWYITLFLALVICLIMKAVEQRKRQKAAEAAEEERQRAAEAAEGRRKDDGGISITTVQGKAAMVP